MKKAKAATMAATKGTASWGMENLLVPPLRRRRRLALIRIKPAGSCCQASGSPSRKRHFMARTPEAMTRAHELATVTGQAWVITP